MRTNRRKTVYLVIEGINAFATAYYFNYNFFLLRDRFGFGNFENLLVSALHGLIYVVAAWYGGKFAQRHGGNAALNLGFVGMIAALMFSMGADPLVARLGALAAWTMTMCFTWPALEAIISADEDERTLPRMIGLYNVTWAGSAGLAILVGGALFETLGEKSIYWFPAILHGVQIFLVRSLEKHPEPPLEHHEHGHHVPEPVAFQQPIKPDTFLKMAWLANPFAYIAINTVLAVIPSLAERLELSTAQTGMFCSLWFFVRLASFFFLWQWTGWHYQFRWLALAFCGLIAGFAMLLLARELWLLIVAQVIFGVSTGLIYYSSLFYSMDVGEDTQGEHGGLHEAAIGLGICLGPAIGAAGLYFAPRNPNANIWAVTALLVLGLAALLWLRFKSPKTRP